MSENNTNNVPQTEKPRKTAEQKAAEKKAREDAKRIFASAEEARQNKPEGDYADWRLFRVVDPTGKVAFTWSFGRDAALLTVARKQGWNVAEEGKAPTKDKVANLLKQLSPEDQALLIAQFVPPTQPTTPAPEKTPRKAK